ncbi:MAG TPA: heme o synthase [Thermoanaerobaculia bacterium]|jgi:protoheme IX farnesyltransferase|nr:heme o synthase [Thermoanaerobaculia bacterium]
MSAITALSLRERVAEGRVRGAILDHLELSKSRIVLMVLMTTAAGYVIGAHPVNAIILLHTLIGTALVAAGTNALNQYVERDLDAMMKRTHRRPLPAGRISPNAALIFSIAIAIIGTLYLGILVNWLTAFLGAFTLTTYIFVYTPLKRVSTICTIVGAIPGAIPPLMGWTAATGALGLGGWIAFGILFFWQLPHFMAISWMYREDYGRAGFAMLSVIDDDGKAVARQAILYSLALVTISIAPFFFGMAGLLYLFAATLAGLWIFVSSLTFLAERGPAPARSLFMSSNIYLLAMMLLFVFTVRG